MQDYRLVVLDRDDNHRSTLILASDDEIAADIASAFEPSRAWELHRDGRRIDDALGLPESKSFAPARFSRVDPKRMVLLG